MSLEELSRRGAIPRFRKKAGEFVQFSGLFDFWDRRTDILALVDILFWSFSLIFLVSVLAHALLRLGADRVRESLGRNNEAYGNLRASCFTRPLYCENHGANHYVP